MVSRPRLIDCLTEGLKRKLTVISAPAGFGKTTLLGEWVGHVGAFEKLVCDMQVMFHRRSESGE